MSRLLIILGAGASYDLIEPIYRSSVTVPVIPMTANLLDGKYRDDNIASEFVEINRLFSRIAPRLKSGNGTFEENLAQITNKEQQVALRFYLSKYFYQKSHALRSHTVNNYDALVDYIVEAGGADVVNFNYDTVFDDRLANTKPQGLVKINDYISGPIRLFKVHGSSDWFYLASKDDPYHHGKNITSDYEFAKVYPEYKTEWFFTRTEMEKERQDAHRLIPAIALPVTGHKSFVCPSGHQDVLKDSLTKTEKILIIGWKAQDKYLLELMKEKITKPVKMTIVTGSPESAQKVGEGLHDLHPNLEVENVMGGFTEFLGAGCMGFFDK